MSKRFLGILAVVFLLPLIYMGWKYGGTEPRQYIFPLLSYLMVVYGSIFFDRKYYLKVMGLLMLGFCSIFIIIAFTDPAVPFVERDYMIYMAFAISMANIFILFKQIFGGGQSVFYICHNFICKLVTHNAALGILFFC